MNTPDIQHTRNTQRTRVDNAALFAVLSSLADNKQAIGRRYAYWCNGAPALEAAVAAAAMTQDELGHARTLYPLLDDFVQAEADPMQVEPETRTLHYSISFLDRDFAGWSDFVATNFLFDTALSTFFEAVQNASYEPLRQRARKILQEERIHAMHAEGWVRRLAKAQGIVPRTLQHSLDSLWNEVLCWFGPNDEPAMRQLYRDGILDAPPNELRSRYLAKVMPVLASVRFSFPASYDEQTQTWNETEPLPWSRWDAATRRLTGEPGTTSGKQDGI
jgi:phenylacetate-CoA oxygenase PaaI subunit